MRRILAAALLISLCAPAARAQHTFLWENDRTKYEWGGDQRFNQSWYIGSGGTDRVIPGFDLETATNVARVLESAKENGRKMYRVSKMGDSRAWDTNLWTRWADLGVLADSTGFPDLNGVMIFADSSHYDTGNYPIGNTSGPPHGNAGAWGADSIYINAAWDSIAANDTSAVCFIFNGVNDVSGHVLGDSTVWRDSMQVACESLLVRNILPVLTSDIPAVSGGLFNDPKVLCWDRQKRDISDSLNIPFVDVWASFMDAASALRAARPTEFTSDSTAIFGNEVADADSGLVKSSDLLHMTAGTSVTTGAANSRNWSTMALTQMSGQALATLMMAQFMDFLRQIGEAEGDVGGP